MAHNFPKPSSDPSSLGHHFHVRLNGLTLDDIDKKVLETLRPIGVQITDHNVDQEQPYEIWLDTYRKLIEDVYTRTGREKMLVSIDHEGGRVHRLPQPITHFPSAFEYCSHAKEVAEAFATELRSLGINILFGPCADIHSNPDNPIIAARAFGVDPKIVAEATAAFTNALEASGVVACPKHFPGHGDTSVDSHMEIPVLTHSYQTLRERELVPFERAIKEGVSAIMTAHILFPELDSSLPATLSPHVLKKVLREDLGFNGAVITDDLDMKAIKDTFPLTEIVSHTITATCDILLLNHEQIRGIDMAKEIHRLHEEGVFSTQLLEDSAQRIHQLVEKTTSHGISALSEDILNKNSVLNGSISRNADGPTLKNQVR